MAIASNRIELITKYSPQAWDKVYKQESMSSLLDTATFKIEFTGAKTVRIGKWQNGGLKDYYRNNIGDARIDYNGISAGENNSTVDGNAKLLNQSEFVGHPGFGYQRSATRFVWEEFTLKCDRAAAFQIEQFDNEESGERLITEGVKEISRTTITPEVDAYCFSTLASFTSTDLKNRVEFDPFTPVSGDDRVRPLAALNSAFLYFANREVTVRDQLFFVSPTFMNALRQSTEVTKFLAQTDFDNKDISFTITKYEGRQLVEVAPERFRTNIVLFGQEGFTWGQGSQAINFLGVSKEAVTHIVKYEKVKVISGDLNLAGNGFDGYTIYARIYHDVFVPDNKRIGIYCSLVPAAAGDTTLEDIRTVETALDAENKVSVLNYYPADKMVFFGKSESSVSVGATVAAGDYSAVAVGDTLAPAAAANKDYYIYALDSNRTVLAVKKVTAIYSA